jgi:uncharacterized protein
MVKAVFDTTVLVSAFLRRVQGGASFEVLRLVQDGAVELFTSDEMLEEAADALIRRHIRRRYQYPDAAAIDFCKGIAQLAVIVSELPEVRIVRDPEDDMIIACAIAAGAEYIVTRDKDLLSLGNARIRSSRSSVKHRSKQKLLYRGRSNLLGSGCSHFARPARKTVYR